MKGEPSAVATPTFTPVVVLGRMWRSWIDAVFREAERRILFSLLLEVVLVEERRKRVSRNVKVPFSDPVTSRFCAVE